MSKVTTFQELRHKCAELYCPKGWTIDFWSDFYNDCINLIDEDKEDDEEWIDSLCDCYNVSKELIGNVVTFIKENVDEYKEI